MKRILLVIIIIALAFLYFKSEDSNDSSFSSLFQLGTSIEDILKDPVNYEGKKVTVSGRVKSSISFGLKMYVIDDGTGEIYVKTSKAVPLEGEEVSVTGIFSQFIKIGSTQYSLITED